MTDSSNAPPPSQLEKNIGIVLLLFLLIGAFLVMQPFLTALAWAFIMAYSLWPVQKRLLTWLRGRRTLAALILTLSIAMVLVLPTVVIVANLADDTRELATAAKQWAQSAPAPPGWLKKIPLIGNQLTTAWQDLATDASNLFERARRSSQELEVPPDPSTPATAPTATTQPFSQTRLGSLLARVIAWIRVWLPVISLLVVQGVTQILLSVFLTFFIFRDGAVVASRLGMIVVRIAGDRGTRLLDLAGNTVRGVVYGILGTALVQGTLAGIGFLIAGVPGPALLGLLTFFSSPLPLGPPLIWIPATIWLFQKGHVSWGIFMLIWGIGVSTIDNFVKPLIISRGSATPFLLILIGVVGGALAFGFIGVFIGPTLLAVVYRLIDEWSEKVDATKKAPIPAVTPQPIGTDA